MRLVVSLRPLIMAAAAEAFGLASQAAGGRGRSGGAAEAEAKVEAATEKERANKLTESECNLNIIRVRFNDIIATNIA